MIPILFSENIHDELDFADLGIGRLNDCIKGRVHRVLNGIDELEITYPADSMRANDIQISRIILAQPEYKKHPQPYRIYQITKQSNGMIYIYARHIREWLNFVPVTPFTLTNVTAEDVFDEADTNAVCTNWFTFQTDITTKNDFTLSHPASMNNILGGMNGSLLDVFGGEYEFDFFTVKLLQHRGADNGVELRYGKNIRKAVQDESLDGVETGIVPYWAGTEGQLVTLPENEITSAKSSNYPFRRTVVKDCSDAFDEQPTENQLRTYAQSYINRTGFGDPQIGLEVDFEHLAIYEEYKNLGLNETINLGDTVHVIYEHLLGINATARVLETDYDFLKEKYNRVGLGKFKYDLATVLGNMGKG